jgi:S-adenosylmethionine uptake transporter
MQSLWMVCATFTFAIMGVCVKLVSDSYSIAEIVMVRGVIGVLAMWVVVTHQRGTLKTAVLWQHGWRGLVGVIALSLWFFSFSKLPLGTATTLNYMSPIWIAAILLVGGWWRSHKQFDWVPAAAIMISAFGVVLLLQPSMQANQWRGAAAGIGSGILSAFAVLQVRKLGRLGEPEYRVVFYFALSNVVLGMLGALWGELSGALLHAPDHPLARTHSVNGILLLLVIGITATAAQMALTRAYSLGKTLVTANLQYTGIVFSSIWGIIIWHDQFGWQSWLGICVIIASGIAATFYNARSQDREAAANMPGKPLQTPI